MGGEDAAVAEGPEQPARLHGAEVGEDPHLLEVGLDGDLGLLAGGVARGGDEVEVDASALGIGASATTVTSVARPVAGGVEEAARRRGVVRGGRDRRVADELLAEVDPGVLRDRGLSPGDRPDDLLPVDRAQHRLAEAQVGGHRVEPRLRAAQPARVGAHVEVELLRTGLGNGLHRQPPELRGVVEGAEQREPVVEPDVDLARLRLGELRGDVGDESEDHPVQVRLVPPIPVVAVAHQGDRLRRLVSREDIRPGADDDAVEGVGPVVRVRRAGGGAQVDGLRRPLEVGVAVEGVLQPGRGQDAVHPRAEREIAPVPRLE